MKITHTPEGKCLIEFDETPRLLFVSPQGDGRTDKLIIDGKRVSNSKLILVRSEWRSATEHAIIFATYKPEYKEDKE